MASATLTTAVSASTTFASAFALTTTFTAPTQCAQSVGGLTMLENDGFEIWLNALIPVPGVTITSCYPSQFVSSFLLQTGGVTQAPFSRLVCPQGYATQGSFTSNYIACCPSGWDGLALEPNPPPGRPAFGATCFSNIYNVPILITSYDNSAAQATTIFTATGTADQAFAYPYEGFTLGVAAVASITPTSGHSSTTTTISHPTLTEPSNNNASGQNARETSNMGAVAGAIVGSILAAILLTSLVAFGLNYRKKRMVPSSARSPSHGRTRPDYAEHIRLDNDSPTPMVDLDQPPKVVTTWRDERRDEGLPIEQLPRYKITSENVKGGSPAELDEAVVLDDTKLYDSDNGEVGGEALVEEVQTFLAELEAEQEREMREIYEMDASEAMMVATIERMKSKKLPALPKKKVPVESSKEAKQLVVAEDASCGEKDVKAVKIETVEDSKAEGED